RARAWPARRPAAGPVAARRRPRRARHPAGREPDAREPDAREPGPRPTCPFSQRGAQDRGRRAARARAPARRPARRDRRGRHRPRARPMSDDPKKPRDDDKNPLRSMGTALGGWAKRVGTILSEVTQQGPPEEIARAITEARAPPRGAAYPGAVSRLREPLTQRPTDAHLRLALATTRVAQVLTGGAHLTVLLELAGPAGKRGERALPETLAEAARLMLRDEYDPALDQLRR